MSQELRFDEDGLPIEEPGNEAAIRAYWPSRTPQERLAALDSLRRRKWGDAANGPLVRVLQLLTREEADRE